MQKAPSLSFFWKLIIAIVICELTGVMSSFLSMTHMYPWFSQLQKPSWNPPASIFAPVWTTLYLMMGISLALVWKTEKQSDNQKEKLSAMLIFASQLFLNFWWSIAFFRFHSPPLAFGIIVMMLLLILITILKFSPFSKVASWLLIPYISWVSFATVLNYTIWQMNV